jgi:hypothetical protein
MMEIALPALAVTFAAFLVWLTVRFINRRERWVKWALILGVGLLAYPLSYVAYFKWAVLSWPKRPSWVVSVGRRLYWPLTEPARKSPACRSAMNAYMRFWGEPSIDWNYHGEDDDDSGPDDL